MSLLSIVQSVCNELEFEAPSTVIGSANATAVQMLALANRGGKILAKRGKSIGGWSVLTTEHTFTTVASQAEYALPDDFAWLIADTLWDRENYWKLRGTLSPQAWQQYKSGIVASGPRRRVRIKKSDSSNVKAFFVDPTPEANGETLVYEYVSDQWCQDSVGTGQTAWAADDDTGILDEDLLELDLRWRFLQRKGLPYADEQKEFELELAQALARDGGAMVLDMGGSHDDLLLDVANIQDGDFPSS